ncbi:prephenate dehydratase [Rhodococcus aerolatus]
MLRVAYLGPRGTFCQAALEQLAEVSVDRGGLAGEDVEAVPATTPPEALDLLRAGDVDAACVPIENSVEGQVTPTMDALATGAPLQVVAEAVLPVSFAVLVRPGAAAADVRAVRTHPHAAAQVRRWVEAHLPGAVLETTSSTAAAAEDVAAGRVDAAVATALAGRQRGLLALAEGVADVAGAQTRFVLVRRPCPPPARTGHDRTAVVLELTNVPGALVAAMTELAVRGIDLTRIESRPTRTGLGTYWFALDWVGHVADRPVAEALAALRRSAADVRYLGSWPAAEPAGTPPPDDADAAAGWVAGLLTGRP